MNIAIKMCFGFILFCFSSANATEINPHTLPAPTQLSAPDGADNTAVARRGGRGGGGGGRARSGGRHGGPAAARPARRPAAHHPARRPAIGQLIGQLIGPLIGPLIGLLTDRLLTQEGMVSITMVDEVGYAMVE